MFPKRRSRLGFTLTELIMSIALGSVVALLTLAYMRVATVLAAKNLSTNFSHNSLHKSLDWITDRLQEAEYIPVLLTTGSGSISAGTQVMGIYYDRMVGSPYVFPNTSGTISAGATSVTLQYSSNAFANPPAPSANDVLLVNGATLTTGSGTSAVTSTPRPMVSSATVTTSGSYQSAAITLTGSFGTSYTWNNTSSGTSNPEYQTAMLVHREAFIVISNTTSGKNELRYYPNFETVTTLASPQYAAGSTTISYVTLTTSNLTALNTAANYQVLTDQIGTIPTQATPYLPFSETTTSTGATLVGVDIRIRGTVYNNVLDTSVANATAGQTKEAFEFSQFARVITITPLREHPATVFQ